MSTARRLRHTRGTLTKLAGNAEHGFAAEQALVHYPSGAIYTFIPKNACSTMRVSLAIANGCIADTGDWNWIHLNNRTFAASSLREIVMAPYSFVILRCPWRRLASVFMDKLVDRQGEFWFLHEIEAHSLDPDTFTFRRFVELIARPGMVKRNIHWRTQGDYLVYEDYDDWFCLEDFGGAAARLHDKIGLELVDARALTQHGTGHLEKLPAGNWADTPIAELDRLKRGGQGPEYRDLFDDFLRDTVWRIYHEDVALYRDRFGADRLLFPEVAARKPPKGAR